jgi:hypothetical protein
MSSESKLPLKELVQSREFIARYSGCGGLARVVSVEDAVYFAEQHADAAVKPLREDLEYVQQVCRRINDAAAKLERERDEARELVERLLEALTPSGATKAAYIGEVTEPDATRAAGKRTVSWTAIKDTMALIRQRAALKAADGGEGER